MEKFKNPEQALGDNAEHAKVYTLGEFLAGRSHHLAIFGAEPVGHGNNRFKSGRNGDRCLFKSRTVDAVLQNSLKSDTRGIGDDASQEVGAHGTAPEDITRGHDTILQGILTGLFLEFAAFIPAHAHGVILTAVSVAGVCANRVAYAHGHRRLDVGGQSHLFADGVSGSVKGQFADNIQITDSAGKSDCPGLSSGDGDIFLEISVPLAAAPGGLAVDHKAKRSHGSGCLVNQVYIRGISFDGSLELIKLERTQNAAPRIQGSGIKRRRNFHVLPFGRFKQGQGIGRSLSLRFRLGLLLRRKFLLLLLGFFYFLGILFGSPAHFFAKVGPAHHNHKAENDGNDKIFTVLHEKYSP